jgi:hypothetical protein
MMPLSSIAMGATIAPKVEVLTMLACEHLRPELTAWHNHGDLNLPTLALSGPSRPYKPEISLDSRRIYTSFLHAEMNMNLVVIPHTKEQLHETLAADSQLCKSDPLVQKAVAKLSAGEWL